MWLIWINAPIEYDARVRREHKHYYYYYSWIIISSYSFNQEIERWWRRLLVREKALEVWKICAARYLFSSCRHVSLVVCSPVCLLKMDNFSNLRGFFVGTSSSCSSRHQDSDTLRVARGAEGEVFVEVTWLAPVNIAGPNGIGSPKIARYSTKECRCELGDCSFNSMFIDAPSGKLACHSCERANGRAGERANERTSEHTFECVCV